MDSSKTSGSISFLAASPLAFTIDFGISGGNRTHNLCPWSDVFQALVIKGSIWTVVPDRFGLFFKFYFTQLKTIYMEDDAFHLPEQRNLLRNIYVAYIFQACQLLHPSCLQLSYWNFIFFCTFRINRVENHLCCILNIQESIWMAILIFFLCHLLQFYIMSPYIVNTISQMSNTYLHSNHLLYLILCKEYLEFRITLQIVLLSTCGHPP